MPYHRIGMEQLIFDRSLNYGNQREVLLFHGRIDSCSSLPKPDDVQ